MIDLAGIDQIVPLAPADLDSVPFAFVEREARDGQRLSLRAGLLEPAIPTAARVRTVAPSTLHLPARACWYARTSLGLQSRSFR